MAKRRYNHKKNQWIIYVALGIVAMAATWLFWPEGNPDNPEQPGNPDTNITDNRQPATKPSKDNVVRGAQTIRTIVTTTQPGAKSKPEALAIFNAGNDAFGKQNFLEARGLLSKVLFAGGLAEDLAEEAREKLTYISSITLFARTVDPRDPYTMRYKFKRGDHPATV